MDEDRLARVGSFSAVCSPPLSMMFKGRMSKSSKSKKIELTDELDDEICDALCKISKSSEELWKEVSTIFSPPTPIGSKVSDYTPFDSYKHPNSSSAPRPSASEGGGGGGGDDHHPNSALALLATTSGDRGSLSVTRGGASQTYNTPQFLSPYPPAAVSRMLHPTGATVPNSIQIPQIVVSKDADRKKGSNHSEFAQPGGSTTITSLKRPKRSTRNDHLSPPSLKKPNTGKGGDGKLNAANISSIINNTSNNMSDSDSSVTSESPHEESLDTHNQHRNGQNSTAMQLQSMHNIAGLFNNSNNFGHNNNHNNSGSNNFSNFGNNFGHNHGNNNHSNNHNHNNNESSSGYNFNNQGNNGSNFNNSNNSTGNGNNGCSNCSCGNNSHNHGTNNNTNNNNTSGAGINLSNLGVNGNFSTNDKYWTEVIFCCKKLVALAGSGLAGPLSFSELVDALTLARHIMSTTAAVLNSGAYTPFPSTPIADEFNRLVGETFGSIGHTLSSSSSSSSSSPPSSNLHTNLINLNASANNHTYPFFAQGGSGGVAHSALTPPTSSPGFSSSHPDTPPSPSLSMNSPLSGLSSSSSTSSWGSGSSYVFDDTRRKIPATVSLPKDDSSDDDDDDESPISSPPPMSPLSTLSVVPLSPSLSPTSSGPTEKMAGKEKEGKEVKEKEGKEGSWKKPRGKKRPKYEADLMCLSCGVRQTPEWRRGPAGAKTLCNACGLHWAKVLKAEGKGDQKKAALLEAKRSQFMMAAQKRAQGAGSSPGSTPIKSEPLYLSPNLGAR